MIAEASLFLLVQIQELGRWGERERQAVDTALSRHDVMTALADRLMQRPSGRVGKIMRQALSRPGLDAALPRLARRAALPHVRAIALETLVMRRARWLVGYGHEWVDKRYGLRRRVPRFAERPVGHQLDVEEILQHGARDRAVAVRQVVARSLIALRSDLSPAMVDVGRVLAADRAISVRSPAEFYLEKVLDD